MLKGKNNVDKKKNLKRPKKESSEDDSEPELIEDSNTEDIIKPKPARKAIPTKSKTLSKDEQNPRKKRKIGLKQDENAEIEPSETKNTQKTMIHVVEDDDDKSDDEIECLASQSISETSKTQKQPVETIDLSDEEDNESKSKTAPKQPTSIISKPQTPIFWNKKGNIIEFIFKQKEIGTILLLFSISFSILS